MISAADTNTAIIASPTEALRASPSALRVVNPILASVGLIAELDKYDQGVEDTGADGDPESAKIDKRWNELRTSAYESAKQFADANANSVTAWARLAQAAHNASLTQSAAEAAIAALKLSTVRVSAGTEIDGPAVYSAAAVLAAVGQAATAESYLAQLPATPSIVVLLAALAVERDDFTRAMELIKSVSSSNATALRAWLFLKEGRAQEALHELRSVHRTTSPTPETLANTAFAYAVLGSPTKAVRTARQAVAIAPMDETASFNLVGYYMNVRQFVQAHSELDRLSHARGEDADIALARAGIHWDANELDLALGVLQRARAVTNLPASLRASAEVGANIAVLKYLRGDWNIEKALKDIKGQASRAGGRSVNVVMAYLGLLSRTDQVEGVTHLIDQASEWHSAEKLIPARARVLHLQCRFAEEQELVAEWAARSPLNEMAVGLSVYLLGAVEGKYSVAADCGLQALKRLPSSQIVLNNTAYCLAMAGRAREAVSVIHRMEVNRHVPVATAGLVAISMGDVETGLKFYRDAADLAKRELRHEDDRRRVHAILGINQRIILRKMKRSVPAEHQDLLVPLKLPTNWRKYASLSQLAEAALREGIDVESLGS
ncbi:tetratricopeptide repeat protein [Actinoplanes friuliensis]|uniref:tetratricopeptide repeat protein n=1 Tax=Actinoplanes friuliensis TaxID=196914 RepID=UPI00040BB5E5|nr:hypothetical protein [Actinoplanes friuliensis]